MALHQMMFDYVVALVDGASKANKATIYHTWDGWISKGVLHITSRSGARARDVWHFSVKENKGKRLLFKNKTHAAYVYARPGAQNVLEKIALNLNRFCRFEYPERVDLTMHTRGSGCGHCTDNNPPWYVVLTDGELEVVKEADVVTHHFNRHHVGCPIGTDRVRVLGGTFAIQVDVGQRRSRVEPTKVVVRKGADLAHIAKVLDAEAVTRRLSFGYTSWSGDGSHHSEEARADILRLAGDVADGYPYPDHIRERVWKLTGEHTPVVFVPEELRARVAYQRPSEIIHRALVESVVQQIRNGFYLYMAECHDGLAVFLPNDEYPDWDTLFSGSGKLGSWQLSNERLGVLRGYNDSMPRLPGDAVMQAVEEWPVWVEERLREACEKSRYDLPHLPDNLRLADDAALMIIRDDYLGSSRKGQAMIRNGCDPNVGFGRVQWNRFWDARAT